MGRRLKTAGLLLALCAVSTTAVSQELLKSGPNGRPVMVMDEAGNWSAPIQIYSDLDSESFIPDITAPGWIQWHAAQFRQQGTYSVYVYSYYKNDHVCRNQMLPPEYRTDPKLIEACAALRYLRRLVFVDTRKNTVTVLDVVRMERDARYNPRNQTVKPETAPLSGGSPLARLVPRITAIVAREAKGN